MVDGKFRKDFDIEHDECEPECKYKPITPPHAKAILSGAAA